MEGAASLLFADLASGKKGDGRYGFAFPMPLTGPQARFVRVELGRTGCALEPIPALQGKRTSRPSERLEAAAHNTRWRLRDAPRKAGVFRRPLVLTNHFDGFRRLIQLNHAGLLSREENRDMRTGTRTEQFRDGDRDETGRRKRAVLLARVLCLLSLILLTRHVSAGRAWTGSGPPGASALAVDPADPRRVFAAVPSSDVAASEIFLSSDAGASWRDVGLAGLSITRMAAGPSGVLYAAGFEGVQGDFPYSIAAVWKSVDSGASWRAAYRSGVCNNVQIVAASPVDPAVAYLGDNVVCHGFGGALLKTADDGATWNGVSPPLPPDPPLDDLQPVDGFAVAPSAPGVLYLLQRGAWRSEDGGASWTSIGDPAAAIGIDFGNDALAVDAASPTMVYSSIGEQVFRSLDSGATWEATPLSGVIRQLLADPAVPDRVVARSESEIFLSTDGATTWRTLPPPGVSIGDLAVGGGEIYAATGGGVFTFHDVRVIPISPPPPIAVGR